MILAMKKLFDKNYKIFISGIVIEILFTWLRFNYQTDYYISLPNLPIEMEDKYKNPKYNEEEQDLIRNNINTIYQNMDNPQRYFVSDVLIDDTIEIHVSKLKLLQSGLRVTEWFMDEITRMENYKATVFKIDKNNELIEIERDVMVPYRKRKRSKSFNNK